MYNIIEDYTNLKTPDGEPDDIEADCVEVLSAVWDIGTKNKALVERKMKEAELKEMEEQEKKAKERKKALRAELGQLDSQPAE